MMRIAVCGNPNAGKTTLYNALTGSRARVGNYPGVTVERREANGPLGGGAVARFIDLPGCYSLTARSSEEEVAHEVLVGRLGEQTPDAVVCVVDCTQLARGLYLAEQLAELERPMVIALSMSDLAAEEGITIDVEGLSRSFGVPVVPISARTGAGLEELRQALRSLPPRGTVKIVLDPQDQRAIERVREALQTAHQPSSEGEAIWWLTSAPEVTAQQVPTSVRQTVAAARAELDPERTGVFNRKIIEARYRWLDQAVSPLVSRAPRVTMSRTDQIDRVLLHPVAGMGVFVVTMFVLFQAVFAWSEPMIGAVESLMGWLSDGVATVVPEGLLQSLLVNGVLAGVGNILVFLPQIALLFLGITLLEESGYMARAAFLLDSLMIRVGLHGKSFVPLMSSFACAVPGVMAARTVESHKDRLITILIAPFMSCSARLPVYTLVIAAVFATVEPLWGVISVGGLVVTAMYLLGFFAAIGTAALLKGSLLKSPPPALVLELPRYRAPIAGSVIRQVYARCRVFVTQTGTIILAISLLLWGLLTFPQEGIPAEELAQMRATIAAELSGEEAEAALERLEGDDRARQLRQSIGGRIGRAIEPIIEPLGFDWRIGIGLVASFAAREVLVTTLGQVYALGAEVEPDSPALRDALLADVDPATNRPRFTPLVGMSLMVFFVLAMQCMSTLATVKRETNSWGWPLAQLIYMNTLAYSASLVVYQIGTLLERQ